MYRSLEPSKIIDTLARLEARVGERFPQSGLSRVAGELTGLARSSAARAQALARPNLTIRISVIAQIAAARFLRLPPSDLDAPAWCKGWRRP